MFGVEVTWKCTEKFDCGAVSRRTEAEADRVAAETRMHVGAMHLCSPLQQPGSPPICCFMTCSMDASD